MAKTDYTIDVTGLHKSFGKLKVLTGIDFRVKRGTILALLGPNGAGKTTTIKILSTLLLPGKGKALIHGHDVVKEPAHVRDSIGLTGQYAAVDEYLTGEENLLLMGRLYRLSRADIKRRTRQLLEQFDLVEAGKRPVKTYSGGMKRRIDLAMSLIASPPVLFLDEPTTGLDPRSRQSMWEMIKQLAKGGTTILLTTQYMEEADNLADDIVVIDGGKVIAEGSPSALKAKVGAEHIDIMISKETSLDAVRKAIEGEAIQIDEDQRTVSIASKGGISKLTQVLRRLEEAKIKVDGISLRRPTLDDVFLTLTGHAATKEEEQTEQLAKKGKKHG